jgi:predicted RecA/RadA family phage recombinase
MATNFINDGELIGFVAPSGGVVSGAIAVIGVNMFGVVQANAASGSNAVIKCGGTHVLRALNGVSTSAAQGANAHWDATNANVTISATSNLKIGVFETAKANADTTARVRLNANF